MRRCVDCGQFRTAGEAVEEALRLLEERGAVNALQRAISMGLEQAVSERGGYFTVDDVRRRAFRRKVAR